MVNLKRIMAGIIAGATVVSMAACSNGTTDGTSTSSDTETTIDDEIENPVSVGDISIDAGEQVEPAELEYLGGYDITTAGDVKPAYKYFSENYGCTIKCTLVGSGQIQEKLTTAISSGESRTLLTIQTTLSLYLCQKICTHRLKNI